MDRRGIISAGNWLVDTVKMIDVYPAPGNLTVIQNVAKGLGGCAHNVLVDLAKMNAGIPLYAGGCVGNDANGEYVLSEIRANSIDDKYMYVINTDGTSYTDVMSEIGGGATRTFFHYKGANSRLDYGMILKMESPAKIFHLGYLLLLDELDKDDEEYGVVAAKALDALQKKGYRTSVDLVSEESGRFCHVVLPCLKYIDYLIINEVEAGAIMGRSLRDKSGKIIEDKIRDSASWLMSHGVGRMCAIHFPEGGYALGHDGEECWCPSVPVRNDDIVSSVGAGDAFCAGMLYSVHEGLPIKESLEIANTSARFNLSSTTSTGGAPSIRQIMEFIRKNY